MTLRKINFDCQPSPCSCLRQTNRPAIFWIFFAGCLIDLCFLLSSCRLIARFGSRFGCRGNCVSIGRFVFLEVCLFFLLGRNCVGFRKSRMARRGFCFFCLSLRLFFLFPWCNCLRFGFRLLILIRCTGNRSRLSLFACHLFMFGFVYFHCYFHRRNLFQCYFQNCYHYFNYLIYFLDFVINYEDLMN